MLQYGSRGAEVRDLQIRLKAVGYDPGDIDGIFGKHTQAALLRFQEAFDKLPDTGVFGPEDDAALDQALGVHDGDIVFADKQVPVPCAPEVWAAIRALTDTITRHVYYGPGRGLFHNGEFVVTYGPGGLGLKTWKCKTGHTTPSFHCTSLVNFVLGWLLKYNEDYTHAGNIPSLFTLCESSRDLHAQPGKGSPYRGYGPYMEAIPSDGSGEARTGLPHAMDIFELYQRRAELPAILVFAQSSRLPGGGWNLWHHTGLFLIDHLIPSSAMDRFAADGYYSQATGYSQTPVRRSQIDPTTMAAFKNAAYRIYGVKTSDGTYGDPARPRAKISIEP